MAQVINGVAQVAFDSQDWPGTPAWTRAILPPGCYVGKRQGRDYEENFKTWLAVGGEGMRHPGTGEPLNAFAVVLNTAWALGSDAVRLMVRIHGQCEIHGHVLPDDAGFVADIIDTGLASGLYRVDMGWDDVAALLRAAQKEREAVVMSFSVTDSFPGWDEKKDEQMEWDAAFAALDATLEIRAKDWEDYHFGSGITAMALKKVALEKRTS